MDTTTGLKTHAIATLYNPAMPGKVLCYTEHEHYHWGSCKIYKVEAGSLDEAKEIAKKLRLEAEGMSH